MPAGGIDPRWFKRAQRGLYDGKNRLTGNHVSPSKRHVRRHWNPNVQRAHLWSDVFSKKVSINVTTAALRQMDRVGGFDNYVLGTPNLQSALGDRIRAQMHQKLRKREKRQQKSKVASIRKMYAQATPEKQARIEAVLRQQLSRSPVPSTAAAPAAAKPAEAQMQ